MLSVNKFLCLLFIVGPSILVLFWNPHFKSSDPRSRVKTNKQKPYLKLSVVAHVIPAFWGMRQHCSGVSSQLGQWERTRWVKEVAIKPGSLSSIPKTHMVEGKNQILQPVLRSPPHHTYTLTHRVAHKYPPHTHKINDGFEILKP